MTGYTAGIGASAGGLEAAAELLGAVPTGTGIAFVVVQHLEPTHESLLADILAKKTAIPVSVAAAGEIVQPDHVYVIPADAIITVREGRVHLTGRLSGADRVSPIDVLFKSLAASYGDRAIGVVLSGADADGSLGDPRDQARGRLHVRPAAGLGAVPGHAPARHRHRRRRSRPAAA